MGGVHPTCLSNKAGTHGTEAAILAVYRGCRCGSLKGDIDIDIDVDVEVDVDLESYFDSLKGVTKSVQVLFNGIEAAMVKKIDNSEIASLVGRLLLVPERSSPVSCPK